MENTPQIHTNRLILRKFTENDAEPLYQLLRDETVNTFLPMFALKSLQEAEVYLQKNYLSTYAFTQGYRYAVCLRTDCVPIGYVNLSNDESHDFGYALKKEFWHKGIMTEAGRAVLHQLKKDGVPFITATHDVNNPKSGAVMKRLGLTYQYSYEEQWQPKGILVTFRMYQLNFDGDEQRVYKGYWNKYPCHMIENNVE